MSDPTADQAQTPRGLLGLLDDAQVLHRIETTRTSLELLDGLMATDRVVRAVRVQAARGLVAVTVGNITVWLSMPSSAQSRALRALWQVGAVKLALALPLEDGRAMLGFSGPDEDMLVSTRVVFAS